MMELPGITREDEERHLAYVIDVAQTNLEKNRNGVEVLKGELHELLETYGAKDTEALAMWHNTVAMLEETKTDLLRSEKARKKPYFGRIDLIEGKTKKQECYYIGRVGITENVINPLVIDWRAPIATVYYENSLGACSYQVKNEGTYQIDLTRKRTYEIAEDELTDFYDSDVVANDDLLTKYLAKNKKAVLGEIIATIQQEQNEIIRKSPRQNVIVQGVAGSGKTTVAMHRISYILYNYGEEYRPEDFYIVGSNRILLNYITSVLPDLDVYGIRQMTMEQLFTRLLYEDWDEASMEIKPLERGDMAAAKKGTLAWFHELEEYCADLEWDTILREDIYLESGEQLQAEGESGQLFAEGKSGHLLLSKDAIETYIRENPMVSLQNKIAMLNERILAKVHNEIAGKEIAYTSEEKKELLRRYRNFFGGKTWKTSIFDLYETFLIEQDVKGMKVPYEQNRFDVYDLAALAYLYKRIKETEEIREASHVVIDEAQDFGMMAYGALKYCMRGGCTFTIMGDVSQNIHFGYGLDDWEELKQTFLTGTYDSFKLLKKSYRNTVEISHFATDILRHGTFPIYPVEPILRHGNSVRVEKCDSHDELIKETAATIRKWQKKGLETIAVVCREQQEAVLVSKELKRRVKILDSNVATTEFGNGVMVLPVAYTKGLEFDAVIILDPDRESYPVDNGHAKLLYVAATRALHELAVLHTGNLTGLIEDPLPDGKQMEELGGTADTKHARRRTAEKSSEEETGNAGEITVSGGKETDNAATRVRRAAPGRERVKTEIGPKKIQISEEQKKREEAPVAMMRPGVAQTPKNYKKIPHAGDRALHSRDGAAHTVATQQVDLYRGAEKAVEKPMNTSVYKFGEIPDQNKLRVAGHSKADMSVRWNKKTNIYVDIASSYGTLRITPLTAEVIRVSFKRGQFAEFADCACIALAPGNVRWGCRETKTAIEIATEKLLVHVEKKTGAVAFYTRDGKHLLSECAKEPRFMENSVNNRSYMFFDWDKNEKIWAKGVLDDDLLKMNMTAKYISYGGRTLKLPCVLSEQGYGIAFAVEDAVLCCGIPLYGPYVMAENCTQIDYCFLYGGSAGASRELYKIVTGGSR